LLFALATHEQGYRLVLVGAISLDYEITRVLERIAESLMLTGTAH
jgi:diphthamide synthase (EF-2-diphthine--ammonia ligase)